MTRKISVDCCVAGGGPAGLMAANLLAMAGLRVLVLEKHADFLRDFRGDTIHPATLHVIAQLGWLDEFLALPHQKLDVLSARIGDEIIPVADFSHLPTEVRSIVMMPQWDLLNFLARKGESRSNFQLLRSTRAQVLNIVSGLTKGLRATDALGDIEVEATLVIACDGRDTTLAPQAGLKRKSYGAPIDVLWFRLRKEADEQAPLGRFEAGRILVAIDRGGYFQCAYLIEKGGAERLRTRGIERFQADVAALTEIAPERIAEDLGDWSAVKLLSVVVDRLESWWTPGFLAIGDAAHAMSPIGGVGVNLAIQDPVASANLLFEPLRDGTMTGADLAQVEARRAFPTRVTQMAQIAIQNRLIAPTLGSKAPLEPPAALRLLERFPRLRRLPARMVGLGVRPESVSARLLAAG